MTRGQYVPLSSTYAADAALLEAGPLASLVWPRVLALASQHYRTDGLLTVRQLERELADVEEWLEQLEPAHSVHHALADLVAAGLLDRDPGPPPGFRVRSWLEWNRPAAEVEADRERKRASDRERQARHRARTKSSDDGHGPVTDDVTRDANVSHAESRRTAAAAVPAADTAAAAAAQEPAAAAPTLRVENLKTALAEARLLARWDRMSADDLAEVHELVKDHGVAALVAAAKREHRPDAPAAHARAWLGGWRSLERPRLRVVETCPRHPSAPRRPVEGCVPCWQDRQEADREARAEATS